MRIRKGGGRTCDIRDFVPQLGEVVRLVGDLTLGTRRVCVSLVSGEGRCVSESTSDRNLLTHVEYHSCEPLLRHGTVGQVHIR